MSLISSLNIAREGLAASQAAITVASNNISNVDTPGYAKLRIDFSDVTTFTDKSNGVSEANSLSGVQVSQIKRYADEYLESSSRNANSKYSYLNQYANTASNIEAVTNELEDGGLSTALSKFYTAIDALNSTPTDSSARGNYIGAAQTVCSIFNSNYQTLTGLQDSLIGNYSDGGPTAVEDSELGGNIKNVNSLLDQIANVNLSIVQTNSVNASASSLLDERDSLLSQLSGYMNADVSINSNGTASVSLAGNNLVKGSSVNSYLKASLNNPATSSQPVTISLVNGQGTTVVSDVTSNIDSGTIGAIVDVTGPATSDKLTINGIINNLNTMAQGFANIMNTIQTGDPTGNGSTPMSLSADGKTLIVSEDPIFVNSANPPTTTDLGGKTITDPSSTVGITAANITVNSMVVSNKNLIATARVSTVTAGSTDVGNNANVALMQKSRSNSYGNTTDMKGNITTLGNSTIEGYLTNLVGNVGTQTSSINSGLTTQTSVLASINSKLSSETGVNLDEELSDLIKYQRAYEASARAFSTCSDLLGELVQLGK